MDYRVESAVAVGHHQLKIRWTDGLEGIVDLESLIGSDSAFGVLRDPERFRQVKIYEFGHSIFWERENGEELDICPDVLRAKLDPEVAAWIAEQERGWRSEVAAE